MPLPRNQNPLAEAGRFWAIAVGLVCALVSLVFATLLAVLLYLVGWRNPREFDRHELFEFKTLAFFSVLLAISFAFSLFAIRLLRKTSSRLMSPTALRFWGGLFGLGSSALLLDIVLNKSWHRLPHV